MATSAAITQGAHHIGLTVPNVSAARNFFVEALGFSEVGGKPDYPAVFVSDGSVVLTLWQAIDPESSVPFDRKNNVGLHHLALKVDSLATLNSLYETLSALANVEIEFSPESMGGGPSEHFIVYIPGGIRLEFVAKP